MMQTVLLTKPDAAELQQRHGAAWFLFAWLPVIIGVGVIAVESTPTFGGEHTSAWLRPLFTRIFGAFTDDNWEVVHHLIRKTGHFIGYGLLGLTFLRAWLLSFARRLQIPRHPWRMRSCFLAVCCTCVVASADEFHQTFLPNRTGRIQDVMIDTVGAAVFQIILAIVWHFHDRRYDGY